MSAKARLSLVLERIDAVRRLLDELNAPAALLAARRNFAWATLGGDSHVVLASEQGVAGLLISPSEALVLTAVNEAPRIADEELGDLPFEVRGLPWHDSAAMDAMATRIAGGPPLDDATLEPHLVQLRSVLADAEAERIAWLAARAAATASTTVERVTEGMTEHEAAGLAIGLLASEGIRAPVVLAAADDRIARFRHPVPTARVIRRRLMIVLVVERWGLHAAVTRFAELESPDPELARRIEAVNTVHTAMATATRPGATLGEVLAAGRAAYTVAGHPHEWELHHQGGVIGYQGRERIAVPDDPTVIRPGMAFAWNPSVAGAKAEETILLAADGLRVLTAVDRSADGPPPPT